MTVRQPPKPSAKVESKRAVLAIGIGLAMVVLLVFGQSLWNGFVNFDDDVYVYANPNVEKGITSSGIVWAFTSGHYAGNWHPLTWMSHMLDCQIYGLNAGGHHLTNVLLHMATVILLFLALRRLTGALWPSAFVAAVFAIHPLRVESVAWVCERKDMLSGLFFMLMLLMYARYVEQSKIQSPWRKCFYGLMLVFFVLGLMSKPIVVTLPFVLLLLDYWPLQRFTGHNWQSKFWALFCEKLPLFLLAAAASVLTFFTQKSGGAVVMTDHLSPMFRFENALVSYGSYIIKMFWPEHLAVLYPYPSELPLWKTASAGGLLLFVTVPVIMLARRFPYLLVGWLWYLGMLVPVIGTVQAGGQAMADRYSYLPQIGLYLAIVWGMKDFAASRRVPRYKIGIVVAVVIVALMACSLRQISYWRNSRLLWEHTIACTPDNPIAQINLGFTLNAEGRWDEAIKHFQKAIEIRPDRPNAYNGIGVALGSNNRGEEAIGYFNRAVQIQPDYADAHYNLAVVLASREQLDEAVAHFQQAIQINPDYAAAHRGLANLLVKQGKLDEPIEHYQKAVQINPEDIEAHYNLGIVLVARIRADEAAEQFRQVIKLKPDYVNAHGNLANVLAGQGKLDEAVEQYRQTIQLDPNSAQAHFRLGLVLKQQAKIAEATEEFRQTLRLNPQHEEAKVQLRSLNALSN